ncbi:NUDIX domain-containing protein [Arachnia propionica]|uniref:NUDIX hydrolase n=1 Tax=Arachnia propionica TaxID=1750 RepID=UPI0030D5D955
MRVIGLLAGNAVVDLVIGHGEHPDATLYRAGWIARRPVEARCCDGDVVVTLEVRPVSPADAPPADRMVVYEEPGTDEVPVIRQRVGAYGIVLSERGLLGTVLSRITGAPGAWNLPGGGLDAGEEPMAGLLREIHEETGQEVVAGQLLALQSDHWIGRAPNGGLEDYHALRIIYSATCEKPSRPRVHDLGGSTARADWVPVKSWRKLPWTRAARQALSQHLPSR